MAERDDLLASIAAKTADYREGDHPAPTPDHVGRWISQFDASVRLPMLREVDSLLNLERHFPIPIRTSFHLKPVANCWSESSSWRD